VENPVDSKTSKLTKEQRQEQDVLKRKPVQAGNVDGGSRQLFLKLITLVINPGKDCERPLILLVLTPSITIQLATISGVGGVNGMGGITADGNITKFETAKTGKNKTNYSIHIIAMTRIGTYDIFIDVIPNANADASIAGTTSGKLNYHGKLVPLSESRVYKGMAI
jgi:hypothetical protein